MELNVYLTADGSKPRLDVNPVMPSVVEPKKRERPRMEFDITVKPEKSSFWKRDGFGWRVDPVSGSGGGGSLTWFEYNKNRFVFAGWMKTRDDALEKARAACVEANRLRDKDDETRRARVSATVRERWDG